MFLSRSVLPRPAAIVLAFMLSSAAWPETTIFAQSASPHWEKSFELNGHRTFFRVHLTRSGSRITGTFQHDGSDEAPLIYHVTGTAEDAKDGHTTTIRNVKFDPPLSTDLMVQNRDGIRWNIVRAADRPRSTVNNPSVKERLVIRKTNPADDPESPGSVYEQEVPLATTDNHETTANSVKQGTVPETAASMAVQANTVARQVAARVQEQCDRSLGKSYRGEKLVSDVQVVRNTIKLHLYVQSNLTEHLLKFGAKDDICGILKSVQAAGVPYEQVSMTGTYPMQDKFGDSTEQEVFRATDKHSTVDRINRAGFLTDNVYAIADDAWIDPAFR